MNVASLDRRGDEAPRHEPAPVLPAVSSIASLLSAPLPNSFKAKLVGKLEAVNMNTAGRGPLVAVRRAAGVGLAAGIEAPWLDVVGTVSDADGERRLQALADNSRRDQGRASDINV